MEIELDKHKSLFNLDHTLNCGQLFRWKKLEDCWYGVVKEHVIKIKQKNEKLIFKIFPEEVKSSFIERYLRLDDNLPAILTQISKDEHITKAVNLFQGLRLCRQEPWECLISYICATYKSIPVIKSMIEKMSICFGKKIVVNGHFFFTFPKPRQLAKVELKDLKSCGLGFRTKRVLETAKIVDQEVLSLEKLEKLDYNQAKRKLLLLPGVGHKVADCILLFSLEKLEAFPVDRWIKRAAITLYSNHFESSFIQQIINKNSISEKEYKEIGSFGRKYFGNYAGYAQEYLFHFLRKSQFR